MEKQSKRVRDIRFYSKKNGLPMSVHTALARDYAAMLEDDECVRSYRTNVELDAWQDKIELLGIRGDYRQRRWTTDFVIYMTDGTTRIREMVDKELYSSSAAEKLELSRRYWKSSYVTDWKIVIRR